MDKEAREVKRREQQAKNSPLAKSTPPARMQNGELQPTRKAARATPGTDESKR